MSTDEGWAKAQLGMELVLEHERREYREKAMRLLEDFLDLVGDEIFTADEIHDYWMRHGLGDPHHVNVFGAIIRKARRRRLLIPTGHYCLSSRTARHGSVIPYYENGRRRAA